MAPSSTFTSILNFRDVGQTINEKMGSSSMQTGKLFRSARPDEANKQDRQKLVNEYGIKTIVDLRTKTEHIQQAQKRNAKIKSSEAVPQTNEEASEPLQIPGITYHEINFNGNAYSKMLIKQLSWHNFAKLIGLMALGYRTEGIRVLGENVMRQRGLVGLGLDSIDACVAEVLQFFTILADPSQYPVMVHCTQGKDRTGLTVLLALLLLHVSLDAANHDYMLTQAELVPEREERVKEINAIGLPDDFADCDPHFVQKVEEHIQEKYGSIEQYLEHAGIDAQMQQRVKENLAGERARK